MSVTALPSTPLPDDRREEPAGRVSGYARLVAELVQQQRGSLDLVVPVGGEWLAGRAQLLVVEPDVACAAVGASPVDADHDVGA